MAAGSLSSYDNLIAQREILGTPGATYRTLSRCLPLHWPPHAPSRDSYYLLRKTPIFSKALKLPSPNPNQQ
jgi:hypothetical protein